MLLDSDFVLFVWKKYMDNVDSDRNICYGTGNKGCYGIFADSMGVWIQNRMDHEFCFSFLSVFMLREWDFKNKNATCLLMGITAVCGVSGMIINYYSCMSI